MTIVPLSLDADNSCACCDKADAIFVLSEKLSIISQIEQMVNESLQKAESLRQSILKQFMEE